MRMPTSKGGGARYRGPTSSHQYNKNEEEKYLDLIELFKQNNNLTVSLKESHEAVMTENIFLQRYVEMLENRIASLEHQLDIFDSHSKINGNFFKTSFIQDMKNTFPHPLQDEQTTIPRCRIDLQHRHATIPQIHQIPKTHIVDNNGKYVVPSQLGVKVGRSSNKGRVVENDILNAFNGDDLSFWRRNVIYDSPADVPVEGEDVIIEIELPVNLVNNLNINTFILHPHPERGIQIKNIEAHYNSGWQTIKGFQQNDITSIQNDDYSPKRKWYFPNIPVQKIRITLVQKYPTYADGKTIYTLGAQTIGVFLTMFEPSGGIILTPFEMDGIYNIESVEHIFLNRNSLSYESTMDHMLDGSIFDYELYTEDADKMLRPLSSGDWRSQTSRRIWVKTHLYPDPHNGVNPCLNAVRLHYTRV